MLYSSRLTKLLNGKIKLQLSLKQTYKRKNDKENLQSNPLVQQTAS